MNKPSEPEIRMENFRQEDERQRKKIKMINPVFQI